jgi:hypothetical protein
MMSAVWLIASTLPTDVPPNFITNVFIVFSSSSLLV